MIGQRIAHYEITGKLGEGAMGEVYEATDTRLKRRVAIKMLPPQFAADPERVARFRREAEVLASLNHSNIGQIYGLEPAGDSLALVLELVEGPTLADRLKRGALPRKEALRIAFQIAAAVETAHERGIIHRDLKPENVKLTHDGDVKVLDFGLAKGIRFDNISTELTADGALLGTPSYMSPEQVAGRPLDRRTDIWSFGCVLYEMLTGKRAFAGDSIGSLFASIATDAVDLNRIGHGPVRRLVERCLRKDPKSRLRDIGDARVELEELLAGRQEPEAAVVTPRSRLAAPALFLLLLGGVLGTLIPRGSQPPDTEPPRPVQRFSIALPSPPAALHLDSIAGYSPPIAVSPDGQTFVFAALDSTGERKLYLRTADNPKCRSLEGTSGAEAPFFSPDGSKIGFGKHGAESLQQISLADESVQQLVEELSVRGAAWRGAAWLEDDSVVYAPVGQGLIQADLTTGSSEPLTNPKDPDLDHRWPQVLPDQRHVLFTASMKGGKLQPRIVSLESGDIVPIDVLGSYACYVPGGFLVYLRSNNLWAVRIDIESGKTLGKPVMVVEGIHVSVLGNPHMAVSLHGVLAYEPTRPPSPGKALVWVDRQGNAEVLETGKGYEGPRISPTGRKIAFIDHTSMSRHDIWFLDLDSGQTTPITTGKNFVSAVWSPDEDAIINAKFPVWDVYVQRLNETEPRLLLQRGGWQWPLQWREGGSVLCMEALPGRGWDLFEFDFASLEVKPLLAGAASEQAGRISPDDRWLAYVADESGRPEVYVRRYPGMGSKERISRVGGKEPVWSPTGQELFFRHGRGIYTVEVPQTEEGRFGAPQLLFEGQYVEGFHAMPNYDVARDGKHFVMIDGGWGLTSGRLEVHLNFPRELELALAPSK